MNVGFKVTNFFFDRALVQNAMDKATHASLYKAAMRIKITAQRSMRRRKKGGKPSMPGIPPKSYKGFLRDLLFGAFDPGKESMVIGPQKLGPAIVPGVLERGGTETIKTLFAPGGRPKAKTKAQAQAYRKKILNGSITIAKRVRKTIVVRYAARPYMAPSLEKNMDRIPEAFRGSVKS